MAVDQDYGLEPAKTDDDYGLEKAQGAATATEEPDEVEPTEENLPGSTEKMRENIRKGVSKMVPPTTFEQKRPQIPEWYGFTPSNVAKNVYEGAKGVIGSTAQGAADLAFGELNPDTGEIEHGVGGLIGMDTKGEVHPVARAAALAHKFITGPAGEQISKAEDAYKQGNLSEAIGHGTAAALPLVGPWAAQLGEQAGTGDIGGAAGQTAGTVLGGELMAKGPGLAKAGAKGALKATGGAGLGLGLPAEDLLTKGVRPRARAQGWQEAIASPGVQRAIKEYDATTPIRDIQDFHDAIHPMHEKLWDEKIQPALDRQGPRPVDMQPAAQAVRDAITPQMREFNPNGAKMLEDLAGKLEKSRTVQEASDLQKYANGQVSVYQAKYPQARRAAMLSDPDVLGWETARRNIREQLNKTMDDAGETQAAPARVDYGHLTTIEKELERKVNPNERKAPINLARTLGLIGALPTHGASMVAGEVISHMNDPNVLLRRGIKKMNPPAEAPFTPPAAYTPPVPQFPGGQGALTPGTPQGPNLPPGPFEIENMPGKTAMWQQQVGQPPPLETGAPRSPFKEPIGPQPGAPEPPMEPIQGQQQRLPMPETPQEAPLFNLEPINTPKNVPELQRLPGAAGPPQGLEAEPGQVPAKVGEIAGKGEIQTTPAENLKVGDTFVDDKGEPRRVAEIEGDTVKTADGTLRDYKEGEIEHQGELNSPRAQLARGGMFHPGPEEGTEIQGEKPEIEPPEKKPAEDADREKFLADQPDRAQGEEQWEEMSDDERAKKLENMLREVQESGWAPKKTTRTEPVQSAEKAIEAIKERAKNQSHNGQERDYKVYAPGELDPNKVYGSTFLLDDGSALFADKGIQSHMQLAREIGQHHLNDANAIRMVSPDSYELHGMPSEAQLAEMNRWQRGLQMENRQNVHNAGYMYWDFYPEDVKGYSADAHSEQHETDAGSPSDFRRAIEEYYGKEEAGGGGFKPDDVRISTRTPTALRATENPHSTPLTIDMDSVRNAQGLTEKLADVVKQYPDLAKAMKGAKTPAERLSRFVDHIADNLEWLHNQMPPEIREITRKWYDSANKMATDLAKEHDVDPKQTAGVMAALSPQKDWNMNVSLAKRVIDTMKNQGGTVTSPEMLKKVKELTTEGGNPALKSMVKNLKGKTLDQITDPYEKAGWIRLYDEAHNSRSYEEIAPDGKIMGNAKTMKGVDAKVAWGDLGSIEKAVNIMLDGSRENISNQLGSMHKVRNFYNNIIDPNSAHPDVTIDTHAVAAGHIQPFSGNSHEVSMNFGGPSSALTGSNGTYPLYAEAYRKAAAKLGLKPRELQSIVWEQVRDLFPAEWKTAANAKKVAGVWGEYGKGKLTLDAARKQIVDLAGGFKKPEWFEKR